MLSPLSELFGGAKSVFSKATRGKVPFSNYLAARSPFSKATRGVKSLFSKLFGVQSAVSKLTDGLKSFYQKCWASSAGTKIRELFEENICESSCRLKRRSLVRVSFSTSAAGDSAAARAKL